MDKTVLDMDFFFVDKVFEGLVQDVGGQFDAIDFCDMMHLMVAEQMEDALLCRCQPVFSSFVAYVGKAYVALSAVMATSLTEVAEQLA